MSDVEIDAWLAEVRLDTSPEPPLAVSGEYIRSLDLILLKLNDGSRLTIPREQLEGLEDASPEQLAYIETYGTDIAWPALDVDHYLPHLIEGKYASERWKQARKQQQVAA